MGAEACWLVSVIAHVEDSKRYKSAVSILQRPANTGLWDLTRSGRLTRARQSAVDAGWLHYESGGKRRPGQYWVLIPKEALQLDASPVDEDPSELFDDRLQSQDGQENEQTNDIETIENRDPNVIKRAPSLPTPKTYTYP